MYTFSGHIDIIGVNLYVEVPHDILTKLQKDAKKERGPIPVNITIQGKSFVQTLVKFSGLWRLYINTPMIRSTHVTLGDSIDITITYDPSPRPVPVPPLFEKSLKEHTKAKQAFSLLPPYRQKEILRYLGNLKNEETLKKNIEKAIQFLEGKETPGVLFYKRK